MIKREIIQAWEFFRKQGFQKTLLSREAPFLIQFGKYGVCGVIAVLVVAAMIALGESLFPHHFSNELPENTLVRNTLILHFIAFIPSNFVAYALNRWLVFTPGRHSMKKELSLFTTISFLSFAFGEILPISLIKYFDVPRIVVHLSFIVSSALVNFVCRKFFVFAK